MHKATLFLLVMASFLSACASDSVVERAPPLQRTIEILALQPTVAHKAIDLLSVQESPALLAYLEEVRRANKNLQSLAVRVQAARFAAGVEADRLAPEVELGVNAGRQVFSDDAYADKEVTTNIGLALNVSWALDVWGKLSDEVKAAQLAADQESFSFQQAQNMLLVEAANTWIDLWHVRQDLGFLSVRRQNAQNLFEIQFEQYTEGLSDYEAYTAQSLSISQLRGLYFDAVAREKQLLHHLNILRGAPPEIAFLIRDEDLSPVLARRLERIDAAYLAERPDIQAGFAKLQMMDAQTRAAYKALLPQFSISANLLKEGTNLANVLSGDLLWQLVGNVVQPLYNGGQIRHQARQHSKQAEAVFFDYEQLVLKAMEEVANFLIAEQSLYQQWREAETRTKLLQKQSASKKQSYLDGDISVNAYLQRQQELLSAREDSVAALSALLKNRMNLSLALGLAIDKP